ncbi:MAG TPA: uracil-DNA glycosylase family protein [Candidatus Polarisedimenticolia bacterium]
MNRPVDPAGAVRARLEWLLLLGVDELPRGPIRTGSVHPSVPASGPRPEAGSPVVVQAGLFGSEPIVAPAPPRTARGAGNDDETASPLQGLPAPEGSDPAAALAAIREEIGDCRRCRLCEGRTQIVFGVGDPRARLMFVGEGPGADEDRQGEPFVGRAGQLLTRIIESMGLRRQEVYIANVVKCRPPENRTPLPDETGICSPFLLRQIMAIHPRVIVCLGTPAAQTLLGTRATITRLRGVFKEVRGIRIMPTFHPAYLLRNPAAKKEVWEDMKKVIAFLQSAG